MRGAAIVGAMVLAVVGTVPAAAQSRFENEVLRRLDRLERRISDLERDMDRGAGGGYATRPAPPPARQEVVAAVSQLCGADCGMAARVYCKNAGFANGVAVTIEKRNGFDHVTRARCFN